MFPRYYEQESCLNLKPTQKQLMLLFLINLHQKLIWNGGTNKRMIFVRSVELWSIISLITIISIQLNLVHLEKQYSAQLWSRNSRWIYCIRHPQKSYYGWHKQSISL